MDQNITQHATIQIIQENNEFKIITDFNPPIPEDRKPENLTVCEAAAMTAVMAIKGWWNANTQAKDTGEQNNWLHHLDIDGLVGMSDLAFN